MSLWTQFSGAGSTQGGPALYSRAHLHELVRSLSGRPENDEALSESKIDSFLTLAQAHWYNAIAAIAPEALYGPPIPLTTDDGGYTYRFGSDESGLPIFAGGHIEIGVGPQGQRLVLPGVSWAPEGFIVEGATIRFADGKQHTYPQGLYARFAGPPGRIDKNNEPTLMPQQARVLLVHRALAMFARSTRRDPADHYAEEMRAWAGDPSAGDYGILGFLRTQYNLTGAQAVPEDGRWWDGPDMGMGMPGGARY